MGADLLLPSNLTLINATPFTWEKSLNESVQMVQWDEVFPDRIEPGQIVPVTLEFTNASSVAAGDGTIIYVVEDGNASHAFDFSIAASAHQADAVTANFIGASTNGNPSSSGFTLPWSPGLSSGMPFILSAQSNVPPYSSTNMPTDWMHQNLPAIGCQPLRRLCMPGSHDAGMSVLTHSTFLSTQDNTLTQWVDIAGQLDAGFRYFDVRPVISAGQFVEGHYSKIIDSWIGGNGQSLADMITQVNNFLDSNNELVILDLSHTYNTDDNWRALNSDELNRLLSQLGGLKHLYSGPTGPNGDLSSLPLNNFIANGPCVIVLFSDSTPPLPANPPTGIYPKSAMNIYNNYADTPIATVMRDDQLSKMAAQRKSRDDPMFLLSWTLTTPLNIRDLATQAHDLLYESDDSGLWATVYNHRTTSYPNIIMIDGIGAPNPDPINNRNVAALSMAINHVVLDGVSCPS